jgi:putative Holliday junction resolvase
VNPTRVLGLDIGSRRTGVAVSDPGRKVATPVSVLSTAELLGDAGILRRLVDDYEVGELVVGLPKSLDGTLGPQARDVMETAEALARHVQVPVTYHDERLSSAEASRAMAATGADERRRRGAVDKVAATLMLQSWLDSRRLDERDMRRAED